VRPRRLKILGVALALSAIASALSLVFYLLPKNVAPSLNRIEDYVLINEAYFQVQKSSTLSHLVRFPDRDASNDHLRFIPVDEGSLVDPKQGGLGQWPWPRGIHGELLQKLARAHAKVATFDFIFAEPSGQPGQDELFAKGLKAQPTVLGFTLDVTAGSDPRLGVLPVASTLAPYVRDVGFTSVDNPGGWLVGQFFTITGTFPDGRTEVHRSLAAATVENYDGRKIVPIDAWHAKFGDTIIPLDGDGQFTMLPFMTQEFQSQGAQDGLSGRQGAADLSVPFVQSIPYADALRMSDADMAGYAKDSIVVIGPTAQALGDFIVTPTGRYPGVFANLRLMDQLLTNKFVYRVPRPVDIVLILLLPLLIGFIVTQLRATVGIALAVVITLMYSAFSIALYGYTLHWLDLIHVDAGIIMAALFVALYRTITEGADKRVIREMFGKHVSPALVDEMMKHDDPLKALDLSGKRVKVTIFYSDIRGFTAMSEKMSPEQIYGALNEYFEEMCAIVFEHGGYVDKFIGDCLMAVYSAPNPRPGNTDAYEAVMGAWRQQQRILEMMSTWAEDGRPIFTVGMGLNTGEVVMGNLGSSDRLNYTVIGDNVNTAARLYNVALGGQTIISESTYLEVKDHFIVNELTPVFVKGKELPLRNFEVVGVIKPGEKNTSTLLDPENMPQPLAAGEH
jgi:class 3 adenylate cyclase/CHASE2 domain-containing sensor protein